MATVLPDGSAVVQPSGKRAYPTGSGQIRQRIPAVAAGARAGTNKGGRVGAISNQPGRAATPRNNW